jgi:hypothetical protein
VARRRFGAIARVAQRKLMQLDAARRFTWRDGDAEGVEVVDYH